MYLHVGRVSTNSAKCISFTQGESKPSLLYDLGSLKPIKVRYQSSIVEGNSILCPLYMTQCTVYTVYNDTDARYGFLITRYA